MMSIQSNSRIHCNIGFAELAVNLPDTHVDETVPVLVDILRDIPYIDFDRCLAWDGTLFISHADSPNDLHPVEWALPDQLVFATVSALLRIAGEHPEHRESAICAITHFVCRIV